MCSIIGSSNIIKLKELIQLNLYRGNSTFSITEIDIKTNKIKSVNKFLSNYVDDKLDIYKNMNNIYYIVHIQAPTNSCGLNEENIHPAYYKKYNNYLWHNGIILQKDINFLSNKYFTGEKYYWDTKILIDLLSEHKFKVLDDIEGSFACLFHNNENLYMFRTTSCPLFIDKELNISSTKFDNSESIEVGKVYKLDIKQKNFFIIKDFTCKDNPYFFL